MRVRDRWNDKSGKIKTAEHFYEYLCEREVVRTNISVGIAVHIGNVHNPVRLGMNAPFTSVYYFS